MIGPLRGRRSSLGMGSLNVLSGLRSRALNCGSGSRNPTSAQASIVDPASASAESGPSASALSPHTQAPPAMPPNVAVWYSDKARPTTQRGDDSWIETLNSDSASTQQAPAGTSAKWL